MHELPELDVYAPTTLRDAVTYLSGKGRGSALLAGGTWLIPRMRRKGTRIKRIIDLSGLHDLHYVRRTGMTIKIGGLTTISELVAADAFDGKYACFKALGRLFGVEATRNMATVAGNLAAEEEGDLVGILHALDGRVVVQSARGRRIADPTNLGLAEDEMIVEVKLAALRGRVATWFDKFEKRRGGGKGIATTTILLRMSGNRKVDEVKIVVSRARGNKMGRAYVAESELRRKVFNDDVLRRALDGLESDIEPSGDFRGSARFRKEIAKVMVKEGVSKCVQSLINGPEVPEVET